jgi:hypothetical protein
VEQVVKGVEAVPVLPQVSSEGAPGVREDAQDAFFWPSLLMTIALSSIVIGIFWDISWHETIGRDTFWTPAHIAIYVGGALAGSVGGWLAIKHTFFGGATERDASVSVFGARAPLGAWVAIWGALAMITSAPFDNWWHNAYGLDVKIISPPHTVLGLGMFMISIGSLLMVLARQNRLPDSSTKGSGLFIYTGGVFIVLSTVFLLEYIFPNQQHGGTFFEVCALMYPARLVAMSCAARVSWPATRIAAVYIALVCIMNWVLALFPAHPKLAPIFNPVTHMVPLPFPLLLIFPAAGIDLLTRTVTESDRFWRRAAMALLLGGVFLAILIPVQWCFSAFLISPSADNWFFMGNRIWGYNIMAGEWQGRFWHNADLLTLRSSVISWIFASASAGVGLFFGRWMRKVRR